MPRFMAGHAGMMSIYGGSMASLLANCLTNRLRRLVCSVWHICRC